jgi:hypothetical protein
MALRLAFPTTALDGRVHREEELTLARAATANAASRRKTPDGLATLSASASAPAGPPTAGRRRVVLPDPVAFK